MTYKFTKIIKTDEGYLACMGFSPVVPYTFSSMRRMKIAINLWLKFSKNPPRLRRYLNHLSVENRFNYSEVWGKLIPVSKLKELSK